MNAVLLSSLFPFSEYCYKFFWRSILCYVFVSIDNIQLCFLFCLFQLIISTLHITCHSSNVIYKHSSNISAGEYVLDSLERFPL